MIYKGLIESVINGNSSGVEGNVNDLLNDNIKPLDIINNGLSAGMAVIGERFKNGEIFVPEVLMSAKAMNTGVEIVKPLLKEGEMKSKGTVVIGTVKGDLHDIGKNLVGMMMESAGFEVIDIGFDASSDKFLKAVKENEADIVCMSAMLTTTMTNMKKVIAECKEKELNVHYMIGGAPVSNKYGEEIGAVYTLDASSAAEKAIDIMGS